MLALSRLVIFTAVFVMAAAAPATAQQRGSISGRVLDTSGLPLPGATITVTNQNTGFNRSVVTAETGAYTVANLEPGTYTLVAEMPGFGSMKRADIALGSGSEITLELKLNVAGLQEEVVVTGAAPLVERTSSTVGGTLSGKEIEDVPANFRNFTALTQLVPGMTPNPAQSSFEGGQVVAVGLQDRRQDQVLLGVEVEPAL